MENHEEFVQAMNKLYLVQEIAEKMQDATMAQLVEILKILNKEDKQ